MYISKVVCQVISRKERNQPLSQSRGEVVAGVGNHSTSPINPVITLAGKVLSIGLDPENLKLVVDTPNIVPHQSRNNRGNLVRSLTQIGSYINIRVCKI